MMDDYKILLEIAVNHRKQIIDIASQKSMDEADKSALYHAICSYIKEGKPGAKDIIMAVLESVNDTLPRKYRNMFKELDKQHNTNDSIENENNTAYIPFPIQTKNGIKS